MKGRDSVSVGLWIATGGRYENDRIKGAAHFLEHILFKGSKKYSCEQIKELIEGVGGSLNAFTSEESTCYFAKIPAKHLNSTFDILADMVFSPLIRKEDVDKERSVILEEIKMYHDVPQYFVMELLDELIWPDHPLGKNLAGTLESVGGLTSEALRRFHQEHYFPSNIVIAACGQLKHSSFVTMAKKKLYKMNGVNKTDFMQADNNQRKAKVKLFKKDIEQMHVSLGMIGLHNDHKDKYALSLLNVILGGNMSSRLFDEVREKRGLAYSISSGTKALKDTGVFLVRAGVDNKKIVQAIEVIGQELERICKEDVKTDELKRAKDYLLGQVLLGLEDTLEHMLWLGESIITLDRVKTLKDVVREVNKVKVTDIKRVANEILRKERFNLALVGPIESAQEKAILEIFEN